MVSDETERIRLFAESASDVAAVGIDVVRTLLARIDKLEAKAEADCEALGDRIKELADELAELDAENTELRRRQPRPITEVKHATMLELESRVERLREVARAADEHWPYCPNFKPLLTPFTPEIWRFGRSMMSMAKRLIEGMSKKDANHIEKFISKVLDMSITHWADEANKRFKEAHVADAAKDDEDESEEMQAYYVAFRNWHALRQTQNGFKAWLDPTRRLPGEDE